MNPEHSSGRIVPLTLKTSLLVTPELEAALERRRNRGVRGWMRRLWTKLKTWWAN